MFTVSLRRCFWNTEYKLFAPRHVAEIAKAFELVSRAAPEKIVTARTSQGVQVSASHLQTATALIDHYSLSQRDGEMSEETARSLLRLAPRLATGTGAFDEGDRRVIGGVIGGNCRVFHLLIYRTPAIDV